MDDRGRTLSFAEGEAQPRVRVAFLHLALAGGTPGAAVGRFPLSGIDVVAIGRGATTEVVRNHGGDRAVLDVRIADARLSSRHARMERTGNAWVLCDEESKNGTLVGGVALTAPRNVVDGDVIEVGSSFLVVRIDEVRTDALADVLIDAPNFKTTLSLELGDVRALADSVARSAVPVIIGGETGTGKEVLARHLFHASERPGRFVAVNCGALAESLVESTLFGHKKGAFSGATGDEPGLFRAADGGVLLLDEIGELPLSAQVKLLRVLQEGEVIPVGDTRPVKVDVRVLAATNRDLRAMVAAGTFRQDLHMRLAGLELTLPPLRDRIEDLGLLVFTLCGERSAVAPAFSRTVWRALFQYPWPGNVRELEQVVRTALELGREAVELEHLPERVRVAGRAGAATAAAPDELLREQLVDLLTRHRGNVSAVARELGKARVQVRRWCTRFAVDIDRFR